MDRGGGRDGPDGGLIMGAASTRIRARVRGRVQGVGFRPYVWRLARAHGLAGHVLNDADGVLIEVEGADCGGFFDALAAQAPALARIDSVETEPAPAEGGGPFTIIDSRTGAPGAATVPPDIAICPDCLREMFTSGDRRFGYAFGNCTQCGPRFTIARGLPYDRAQTAMADFGLCVACQREYDDPADRRHHAQPTACPDCGPRLDTAPEEIAARLMAGEIVAIKGLGGFHLACDARSAEAVARLRARKGRDAKPFAVMVLNLASARALAEIDEAEARALTAPSRPVMVLRGRGRLPDGVSGGLPSLGLMLAYAPIHYLIFHAAAGRPADFDWLDEPHPLALVMTSANHAGEPLVTDDAEARARLSGIADVIAGHDRPIATRCDDSVARVIAGAPVFLRRSRGFVPDGIALAEGGPPVLALGALLKVTACLTRGREAVLSQHVGDVENAATWRFLGEATAHLMRLLRAEPEAVACDLHPDYPTSRFARESGLPLIAVQHHHAHLAAVAAEYGITGPLSGLVLDGFGLGSDGGVWGGELLRMDGAGFTRLGHLAPLALPGGDKASAEPWRMGAAALHALGRGDEIAARFPGGARVARMLAHGLNCPETTSCGRLFDAAAALLGVRTHNRFEGEAAMALEALCTRPRVMDGGWRIDGDALDLSPLMDRLASLDEAHDGADLFHGTLAAALADFALARLDAPRLALSGGCIANRPLTEALAAHLAKSRVETLIPRQAPPGDGGLSLGQALIARRKLQETD